MRKVPRHPARYRKGLARRTFFLSFFLSFSFSLSQTHKSEISTQRHLSSGAKHDSRTVSLGVSQRLRQESLSLVTERGECVSNSHCSVDVLLTRADGMFTLLSQYECTKMSPRGRQS